MIQAIKRLFSSPFQLILIVSFSLVAALTIVIGSWVISRTIADYLSTAMNERVARDMQLAQAFFNLSLSEIESSTGRLSKDPLISDELSKAIKGELSDSEVVEEQIANNLSGMSIGGNQMIAVIDGNGDLLYGWVRTTDGRQSNLQPSQGWNNLAIVDQTLSNGDSSATTEIIPVEMLEKVGLADQAKITIFDTPKAAAELYDSREGSAGLALTSISPVKNENGQVLGAVLAMHMFNNDFTLVDRIREVAGIDTATIFLGDLRVSTNVMTPEKERAIGTRVSEEVSQVVLDQGKEYVGPAFVVNEDYLTRYDPLVNSAGERIGILYVGAKQASFSALLNNFNQRIILVAIGTIFLAVLLSMPVTRAITRPLNQLKELVEANRKVAAGDMSVRVQSSAGGEIGLLTRSFNTMVDTLQSTQDQLVETEKLASLGQLSAGVAHELNNPLGTILLYSDILRKELGPDSPYRPDLEVIVNETKRCKGIVAALLEFARQNQVTVHPIDLNDLIKNVMEVEIKKYDHLPIQFITKLNPKLPIIQADPNQLIQVLVNLIENGVDAMNEGGELTIQTRPGPEGMVTMEIHDTGIGILPEDLNKLFTPFFTTKPVGKGTGLGLAIIYGIIKMHRGQITVRSDTNDGTTFTIQLPIKHQGNLISNQNKGGIFGVSNSLRDNL